MKPARPSAAGRTHPGGIEVDDDPALQRRIWTLQRLAWGGFALILLAALAGLTGQGGPAARQHLRPAAAIAIDAPRILRAGGGLQDISVTLSGRQAPDLPRDIDLVLDAAFLNAFRIDQILPEPLQSRAEAGGIGLRLSGRPDDQGRLVVRLHLRPRWGLGVHRATLNIDGQVTALTLVMLP